MFKAITFDLDMTLQDFIKFKKEGVKAAAKAMKKADIKIPLKKLEKELFEFYLTDIEGDKVFENFLRKKGIKSEKALATAINAYIKTKLIYLKPYPKVKTTLAKIRKKGVKLAIVTDAPRLKAYQRLDTIGITKYFDFLIGLEDTNKKKPSKLPFKKALKKLGLKPSEVMHVGDWPEKDIKGAKSVGMKTCLANYGYKAHKQGKYSKSDFKIEKFEELLEIVDTKG